LAARQHPVAYRVRRPRDRPRDRPAHLASSSSGEPASQPAALPLRACPQLARHQTTPPLCSLSLSALSALSLSALCSLCSLCSQRACQPTSPPAYLSSTPPLLHSASLPLGSDQTSPQPSFCRAWPSEGSVPRAPCPDPDPDPNPIPDPDLNPNPNPSPNPNPCPASQVCVAAAQRRHVGRRDAAHHRLRLLPLLAAVLRRRPGEP
jgi:hypothetical protein